tara:strand:- start:29072 stop:29830 length:759 start_codon:yes stop_codon:yes gene_type:complete
MQNKFSIIMVCKNSEKTIEESINSFFDQDYIKKNLIIIDGGSNDRTVEIIKNFKSIKYFEKINNLGLYASINYGIKKSNDDIIGILHSDDTFFDKNTLTKINSAFENNTIKPDYIYSNIVFIDNLKVIKRTWVSGEIKNDEHKLGKFPAHTGIFLNKSVFDKIGFYDESLKISSDISFIYKLFENKELLGRYLDIYSIKMKLGGLSTKSFRNILIANFESFIALKNLKISYIKVLKIIFLKIFNKIGQIKKK